MSSPERSEAIELQRRVQRLEAAARRNLSGMVSSQFASRLRGQGLLYEESRRYVHGDPARRIDWNVTARLGEPFVKVHLDERRRPIVLVVDISPSMKVGFSGRSKLETAVEIAATLAVSILAAGDHVGLLLFADRLVEVVPAGGGRRQLHRLLASLLRHASGGRDRISHSDPRVAIRALEEGQKQRSLVYFLSDFFDHDVAEDLRYLRARHRVTLIRIEDPGEALLAGGPVRFLGASPEGELAARRVGGKAPDSQIGEREARLLRVARSRAIGWLEASTAESVPALLARHFHRRRRAP
ncbi:MAG: DUF58 domain-containing protein [Acidobacteriota bacterium]